MQATLTWLDLTAGDRDKMRRVLDLFKEQGTLDEMGLGSLRHALSDALFPGTSSIQTRLRYVLFMPWLYRRLEDRRTGAGEVQQAARRAEVDLIGPLEQNPDNRGIIGQRARGSLVRLPSSVYWSALTRWAIFRPRQSQGWYHSRFDALVDGRGVVGRADDPGVTWSRQVHWHSRSTCSLSAGVLPISRRCSRTSPSARRRFSRRAVCGAATTSVTARAAGSRP